MSRKGFLCVLTLFGLLSFALLGGGCNNNSSNNNSSNNNSSNSNTGGGVEESKTIDMNSVWDGPWTSAGGTATLTTENGVAQDWKPAVSFLFDSCDVESKTGSMVATMVLILSNPAGGNPDTQPKTADTSKIQLPIILDQETFTTENKGGNTWVAKMAGGKAEFTVKLDAENMKAAMSGTLAGLDNFKLELKDISLEKQTFHQHFDMEKILNGAWTASSGNGGGIIEMDNRGQRSVYLSQSDDSVTAGVSFKNTNMETEKTTFRGGLAVVARDSSKAVAFPFAYDSLAQSRPVAIEPMFGAIYRLKLGDTVKGFLLFQSETQAQLVLSILVAPNASDRVVTSVTAQLNKADDSKDPYKGKENLLVNSYEMSNCAGFYERRTEPDAGEISLIRSVGGSLTIASAEEGKTLDISIVGNSAADPNANGTWGVNYTFALKAEYLGGGLYLGNASSKNDKSSCLILMMPDGAGFETVHSIMNIQDKEKQLQYSIGGMLQKYEQPK